MTAAVPVGSPRREYEELRGEIDQALRRVAASGWYVLGPEHDAFEHEFADYLGAAHAIGCGNGTDALELALRAVGCGPGDEVVTVANAGGYAAGSIAAVGAIPVYVDVQDTTLLADPQQVRAAVGPLTAAIVVTHLYGHLHPAIEEVAELCRQASVALVEDCAQATGARRGDRHAGTFGDVAAHSFYPTKNLGALGDGGMVTTDDAGLAALVRSLGQYGWDGCRRREVPGGRNSRLDELQAAVLRVKLRHLDDRVERRREIARALRTAVPDRWWSGDAGPTFAAHLVVTRSNDRDRFRAEAGAVGVETAIHFGLPDHRHPGLPPSSRPLPVTERACAEVVTLPCHPFLTDDEVGRVADCAAAWE